MTLRTRKPTGRVPWPLILLEGPEKAGKSWAAAEFSASLKVGQTYWIDWGEGAADEYGAIPGARYLVVEHDGTWSSVLSAVDAVRDEARRAAEAGEPPVVLVIDSMTAEWELLKDWAASRARNSKRNKALLATDPDAEIDVTMNYWNDSNSRHRQLMAKLMTFAGIVVMTARGKETVAVENGKVLEGKRGYSVEGQKGLAFDASVWVRMSRDHAPIVVGARSVHAGIQPGVGKPEPMPDFTLERLVFDALRCDPKSAHVRDMPDNEKALRAAKNRAWEIAQRLDWTIAALAEDYADRMDGAALADASADALRRYADELDTVFPPAESGEAA